MHPRTSAERSSLLFAALALVATAAAPSAAAEPLIDASLTCRAEAAPGRVLCELRVSPRAGLSLTWVDALVMETPAFARPLRARVAAERYGGADAEERKVGLAFVATGPGVGAVRVKARAVVCRGGARPSECRSESRELAAEMRVGG